MNVTIFPTNGYFTTARRIFADTIFPEGREQRNNAERLANTHPVIGLPNRRAFELAQGTAEADADTVIIFFDANNFGKVNKELGHHTGDQILKNMASVIKLAASRYRVGERCFALGGDEFAVICPSDVADDVRDAAEMMYMPFLLPDGNTVSISGTIGQTLAEADEILQNRKRLHKETRTAIKSITPY